MPEIWDSQIPTDGAKKGTDFVLIGNAVDGARKNKVGTSGGLAVLDINGMPLTAANEPVVESGNGSNGYWARFADGTQICWHTIPDADFGSTTNGGSVGGDSSYNLRQATWTYPAAFTLEPVVVVSGDLSGAYIGMFAARLPTTTNCVIEAGQYNSSSITINKCMVLAVGRWK